MQNLTDELKIYELSKIWKDAEYNFAFWDKVDIDWDSEYKKALSRILKTTDIYEYYKELSRFISLLNDGHTFVGYPVSVMQDVNYFSMLPIYVFPFEDGIFVLNVTENFKDKIPLYSRLKKVNGIDVYEYLRENCYPYIWHANEESCSINAVNELIYGRLGTSDSFTFEKDNEEFEIALERVDPTKVTWAVTGAVRQNKYENKLICKSDTAKVYMTDENIAVIKIISFVDGSLPQKVFDCFDDIKNAKGYIIDLRANGGGNSEFANDIASMFIKGDIKNAPFETQRYEPAFKAWAVYRDDFDGVTKEEYKSRFSDAESQKAYEMSKNISYVSYEGEAFSSNAPGKLEGKVVILANANTASAAEDFIDTMRFYTNATLIGTNTAGTTGEPLYQNLESGGFFKICTCRCDAQNGEDVYNKGFAPDIKVGLKLTDFISGDDPALKKAIELINKNSAE